MTARSTRSFVLPLALSLGGLAFSGAARAADAAGPEPEFRYDHYSTYEELVKCLGQIAAAHPDLVTLTTIGKSLEGRDLVVAIVNNPKTGSDRDKPAMWIDANVHGNEVQGGEVVLYTVDQLAKSFGKIGQLTKLLDEKSFYCLVSQNPDGRDRWFATPNNSSSSRANARPVDDDDDGLVDEDGPDDLDGDGSITQMWKQDPAGRWIRDPNDPRIFRQVKDDQKGEWTPLGSEGIDNDGDGRVNEDPPGGDDMNRNWPSDWQPDHVQFGAGPYPFSSPETHAIGAFILDHPNIAAVQSYHNAGGMILRGPGAESEGGAYPQQDVRMYDAIGQLGEQLLPYYKYMIIWKDLYTVHGGFVNWTAEGLGIASFTNEIWNEGKWFQRDGAFDPDKAWVARDRLEFGANFTDYTEHDHPIYGKVLIGGPTKYGSRVTPTFMLEEEAHRNFAFSMFHAGEMPVLAFTRTEAVEVSPGLTRITVEVANSKLVPTRLRVAQDRGIGTPDLLTCETEGGAHVVAGGPVDRFESKTFDPVRFEPGRLRVDSGVPGRGRRTFRFLVSGAKGTHVTLYYRAQKARAIEAVVNP